MSLALSWIVKLGEVVAFQCYSICASHFSVFSFSGHSIKELGRRLVCRYIPSFVLNCKIWTLTYWAPTCTMVPLYILGCHPNYFFFLFSLCMCGSTSIYTGVVVGTRWIAECCDLIGLQWQLWVGMHDVGGGGLTTSGDWIKISLLFLDFSWGWLRKLFCWYVWSLAALQ